MTANTNIGGTGSAGKIDAGGVASAAGNAIQSGLTAYSIYGDVQDAKSWLPRINAFQAGPNYGGSSLDSWSQAYMNNRHLDDVDISDIGFNKGKNIWKTFEASSQGAMAGGSIVPGWGHLIGGVIGGIGGWAGYLAGLNKANRVKNIVNNAIHYTNDFNDDSLTNTLNNIRENQYNNLRKSYSVLSAYGGPLNMASDGVMSPFGSRFAAGGPLHAYGSDWSNGLIFVNTGGSHEENPNEGVQMGLDPQGVPNLVEEGEVIYNDYVFSKRMRVPKKDKIKYKLGGLKLTYAEAAKKAQKESEERPNDPISKRGLEWIMAKLAESQETQREEQYMREVAKYAKQLGVSPEELLAMIEQQQAQGQQDQSMMQQPMMAAYGGSIHIKPSKRGTFTAAASKHGMGVQEFASKVLANKDDYSPAMVKKANFAKNAAGWKHGLGGNLFYNGGLPFTIGTTPFMEPSEPIKSDYANLSPEQLAVTQDEYNWWKGLTDYQRILAGNYYYPGETGSRDWANSSLYNPDVREGRHILSWASKEANTNDEVNEAAAVKAAYAARDPKTGNVVVPKDTPITTMPSIQFEKRNLISEFPTPTLTNTQQESISKGLDTKRIQNEIYQSMAKGSTGGNDSGYDWSTGLRFAPVLGSAFSLARNLLTPADYSRANEVARAYNNVNDIAVTPKYNYMTYKPIDRMIMANMIGQQAAATRRNIMNTSGGNRGTAIAGLLASDNQYLNKLGEAFIAGDAENYKRYAQTLDVNNNINKWLADVDFNVQRANQGAAEVRAKGIQTSRAMMDAIDAQRGAAISNDLTNLTQGLGDIGWEQFNRNMVNTSNPLYSVDSSGRVFYDPQKMVRALGNDDGRRWMLLKSKYDNGNITDSEKKELDELYRKANVSVGGAYYGNTPVRANGGYLTIKRRRK